MVTKAAIEEDFDDTANDTSIPVENTANVQEIAVKSNTNKYFEHFVTLCVLVASFTLVRTNKLKRIRSIGQGKLKIYFYCRQRDMVSMQTLLDLLKRFRFTRNFYSLDC